MCRYCRLPVSEPVATATYWKAVPKVANKACLKEGYRQEAFLCQCIDADCNDCAFFSRGHMVEKGIWVGSCSNPARDPAPHAQLNGNQVHAFPNFSSRHPCFVHRRSHGEETSTSHAVSSD